MDPVQACSISATWAWLYNYLYGLLQSCNDVLKWITQRLRLHTTQPRPPALFFFNFMSMPFCISPSPSISVCFSLTVLFSSGENYGLSEKQERSYKSPGLKRHGESMFGQTAKRLCLFCWGRARAILHGGYLVGWFTQRTCAPRPNKRHGTPGGTAVQSWFAQGQRVPLTLFWGRGGGETFHVQGIGKFSPGGYKALGARTPVSKWLARPGKRAGMSENKSFSFAAICIIFFFSPRKYTVHKYTLRGHTRGIAQNNNFLLTFRIFTSRPLPWLCITFHTWINI